VEPVTLTVDADAAVLRQRLLQERDRRPADIHVKQPDHYRPG